MTERREGTSTGSDVVHSFADDNVERGAPDVDYVKRRPTYPIGDDPRGREIDFESSDPSQSYGSRNMVYRAYRGQAPLEGQDFGAPVRVGKLQRLKDLRPELPNRSVDTAALDAAKEIERQILEQTDFRALFPYVSIASPAAGANFGPGDVIQIYVDVSSLRNIIGVTLFIDGQPVERHTLPRSDQDVAKEHRFPFIYTVPPDRNLGPMEITARAFNINNSVQGMVADDALNNPPLGGEIRTGLGSLDGRLGQSHGSQSHPPQLEQTYLLRAPQVVASLTVLIV